VHWRLTGALRDGPGYTATRRSSEDRAAPLRGALPLRHRGLTGAITPCSGGTFLAGLKHHRRVRGPVLFMTGPSLKNQGILGFFAAARPEPVLFTTCRDGCNRTDPPASPNRSRLDPRPQRDTRIPKPYARTSPTLNRHPPTTPAPNLGASDLFFTLCLLSSHPKWVVWVRLFFVDDW